MKDTYFQIDKFQNRINNQYRTYKVVLYSTAVLFVIVSIYFFIQLISQL